MNSITMENSNRLSVIEWIWGTWIWGIALKTYNENGDNGEGLMWIQDKSTGSGVIRVTSKVNPDVYAELMVIVGFIEEM